MKTVVLRMICDSGWFDTAGEFIAKAVLVELDLDTGLVRPHFDYDPEVLNACGPTPVCGLPFEPAGLDDRSSVILSPAWDFAGKPMGFHIACRSLNAHKAQLKRWAASQQALSLVSLSYRSDGSAAADRLAA